MWYIIIKYPFKLFHCNTQELSEFILGFLFLLLMPVTKLWFLLIYNSDTAVKIRLHLKRTRGLLIFVMCFTCYLISDKSRQKKKLKKSTGFYFQHHFLNLPVHITEMMV